MGEQWSGKGEKRKYVKCLKRHFGVQKELRHSRSGDTLMELSKKPMALKMKTKTIDGVDYLFIEVGGLRTPNLQTSPHLAQPVVRAEEKIEKPARHATVGQ